MGSKGSVPPPVQIGGKQPQEVDAPAARILMVDDHPPNLVALEAILSPLGQELVKATSGEHALRELLDGDFALILMDVQMPGLDGIETARLIKERPRNRFTPIIFLTAIHKDPSYIFRGYQQGAVDYLLRPFDPEILRAKAQVFVDLWRKTELLKQKEALLRARDLVELQQKSESRYRALTDSMPQCVWAARADGDIYFANKVWIDFAGPTVGNSFLAGVPDEEREPVSQLFSEAVRKRTPLDREQRLRRRDGELRWHLCRMVPELDVRGKIIGWIITATDIHEKKQIEEANARLLASEKEAREQAEVANRTKDEFLATVSHELRTPLNAILGWTRMLRTGAVESKSLAKVLETIERNARAQTQLIEDILDVSRIIAGKLRVNVARMDLHGVARAALDAVRPAAEAKGVQLVAELQPGSEDFSGDPDRLQQIIWNLLANAIKFTPREGRVLLKVDRAESEARIVVEDTGAGISADFLPHVFDRFRQADSSITRSAGGLGLGLAIVRHLVEVHGGTVRAESEGEGKGARFTVQLPLRAVYTDPQVEVAAPAVVEGDEGVPISLAGVDVLVVDDEADARELVSEALERHGAHVRTAATVDEAVALVREHRPDVLLSDIGLPSEDGYALIRRVRELDATLPAAALTAYASADDHRRALDAGFQAHVSKPIDPGDLTLLVASLARGSEPPRAHRPQPFSASSAAV